jgi:Holliday junction resolvase-like predicted endonuclease
MKQDNRTEKRKIGDIGENIAKRFLVKRGFEIVEQNYSKKWGEIDIICRKEEKLHFIEVKSVTRDSLKYVSPETDSYRPEDNLHPWKLKRLSRVIQTYLLGYRGVSHEIVGGACPAKLQRSGEVDWQFDVICVYLDLQGLEAKVNYIEDIIL